MDLDHLYEVVEGENQQQELSQIEINIYDTPIPPIKTGRHHANVERECQH
jgi:hypothetical protein